MHYENAPITEALIDIKVNANPALAIDTLNDAVALLSQEYPHKSELNTAQVAIKLDQAALTAQAENTHVGYLLKSKDEKHTCQLTTYGCTISRIAPYKNWDDLKLEAEKLWNIYKNITHPLVINRIAVRYINRLDIPLPFDDFKDFLKTSPDIAPGLPQALSNFFMQLVVPLEDIDGNLIFNQAIASPVLPQTVAIMLDVEVFKLVSMSALSDELWRTLENLRLKKNEVFEASITDKARELFR